VQRTVGSGSGSDMTRLTRRAVFAQAWPITVGQALVPMVGIVDAAVIGHTGDATALAGVALGATVITLIFWTFSFLRMGVTGITSQAQGAGDTIEVMATLVRSVLLGGLIGLLLLAASPLIVPFAFDILSASPAVAHTGKTFVHARLFGAPGALGFYAINGWLLGLGRTRLALGVQIVLNGVNIGLDLLFVWGFGLGAAGVGFGTALAEWSALLVGLLACRRVLGPAWREQLAGLTRCTLLALAPMKRLIAVNTDIMIRTLALLALFTWFANAGSRLGAVPLAANHILMQLVSVSAFMLDGFPDRRGARGNRDRGRLRARSQARDPPHRRILAGWRRAVFPADLDHRRGVRRAHHARWRDAGDGQRDAALLRADPDAGGAELDSGRHLHRRDARKSAEERGRGGHARLSRDRLEAALVGQ